MLGAGERVECSVPCGSLEEIERVVLGFGEHATVIEPETLKERVRKAAEKIGDSAQLFRISRQFSRIVERRVS